MILPVYHVNLCNKQTNCPCFLFLLSFLKCFCIYLLYCGEWSFSTTATTWRSGDNFQWSVPSFHRVGSREEMQVTGFWVPLPSEQRLAWLFYLRYYQWQPKRIFSAPLPPQTLRCYCSMTSSNTVFAGYLSLLTSSTTYYGWWAIRADISP